MSNEITHREYEVCDSIGSAIQAWFDYGLPPGSCTEFLLRGDYERAKLSAHMLLRPDKIWNEHVEFVKNCVPAICRGENYDNWKGYDDYLARKRCRELVAQELDESGAFEV